MSLKSFDNSCDNSYTKFAVLEIKSRFTFGESNLYCNVALSHYVICTIDAFSLPWRFSLRKVRLISANTKELYRNYLRIKTQEKSRIYIAHWNLATLNKKLNVQFVSIYSITSSELTMESREHGVKYIYSRCRGSGVFIINFEYTSSLALVGTQNFITLLFLCYCLCYLL